MRNLSSIDTDDLRAGCHRVGGVVNQKLVEGSALIGKKVWAKKLAEPF